MFKRACVAVAVGVVALSGVLVSPSGHTPAEAAACIGSDDGSRINAAFTHGGAGTTVTLCAGSTIRLTQKVRFTADRQTLTSDPVRRARLVLSSPDLLQAINTLGFDDAHLSNIVVNGNRAGRKKNEYVPEHLVVAGASTTEDGHVTGFRAHNIRLENSRTGSLLTLLRWNTCTDAQITDSEFIDAGDSMADEDGLKVTDFPPYHSWADGIRVDCSNTVLRGNTIVDATDGAIIIFGSPGTIVENNHIIQRTKDTLGGINLVDATTGGDFTGVVVRNNRITADGGFIRNAISMGNPSWTCGGPGNSAPAFWGAKVTGNVLDGDTMGWGMMATRVKDWQVTGNVSRARHTGIATTNCDGDFAVPGSFHFSKTLGWPVDQVQGTFQPEFVDSPISHPLAITNPFSTCKTFMIRPRSDSTRAWQVTGGRVRAVQATDGEAARFTAVMAGSSTVNLREKATGRFVSTAADGSLTTVARPSGVAERFLVIRNRQQETQFGIRSERTGRWLALTPEGGIASTVTLDPNQRAIATMPLMDLLVDGTCNESLAWTSTDAGGRLLGGTTWTLTTQVKTSDGSVPRTIAVTDNGTRDADPRAGHLLVRGVAWGRWSVRQTSVPTAYRPARALARSVVMDGRTQHTTLGAFPLVKVTPSLRVVVNPRKPRRGKAFRVRAHLPSTATGWVRVRIDGRVVGMARVRAGTATLRVSRKVSRSLKPRRHRIRVTYLGSGGHPVTTRIQHVRVRRR